jgi:hypothetical protein
MVKKYKLIIACFDLNKSGWMLRVKYRILKSVCVGSQFAKNIFPALSPKNLINHFAFWKIKTLDLKS